MLMLIVDMGAQLCLMSALHLILFVVAVLLEFVSGAFMADTNQDTLAQAEITLVTMVYTNK